MSKKPFLIVIVGPTASGKSALAVRLAKRFNGEVISADSRQVYRNLDIGTAKISKKEMRGIAHHLLSVAHPKHTYTVVNFARDAARAIRDINARGTLPILVGGTAFWIDALVSNLSFPNVPPDRKLRRELEKKHAGELARMLAALDPERAATIDAHNPRRLIRAIEIARTLGRVPRLRTARLHYRALWIGMNPPAATLKRRISARANRMIQHGLIRETQGLLKKKISKTRIREFGFEYRAALEYLEKKIARSELHTRLAHDTLAYAKRQIRWFKRNKNIHWVAQPASLLPRLIAKTIAAHAPTMKGVRRLRRKSARAAQQPRSRRGA